MHVESLKVFCDVVGRRSFSQGAAENGISQSAASQIVHQLEEGLGVRLIDRSKRPFVLTTEGSLYYEGCRRLVKGYLALVEDVRVLNDDVAGRVQVAAIYSVGLNYSRELADQFARRYPQASVEFEYHHPSRVCELVAEGQVDLGLVSFPQGSRSIKAVAWREEPMVFVCAPEHPLAGRACLRPDDLRGLEIVSFDRDLRIRRYLDRELAELEIGVRIKMAFDNIDTIKGAIAVNALASFLPEPTIQAEVSAGTLVTVPLEGIRLVRTLGIIHRRGVELGKTVERFLQLLVDTQREYHA
jgi:DNA-binding transcriptional LysR family regulator